MKKLLLILLCLPLLFTTCKKEEEEAPIITAIGQSWEKKFGGDDSEYAHDVQQTTDGGYIVCGRYNNGALLFKTDSQGDSLWSQVFNVSGNGQAESVQQTADGGYIVCGWGGSNSSYNDVWLIKTDLMGNQQWAKEFGGSDDERAYSVQQTFDGGYIITGSTQSFGNGSNDLYLIKTDGNGDSLWAKIYGGITSEWGYSVQQTSDGGYIIGGTSSGDVWLIKTDSQGDSLWSETLGGSEFDQANSVQQTSDGGYIICGTTGNVIEGASDVLLIKTDSQGDSLWAKSLNGAQGYSVQQTSDGGYIICGTQHAGLSYDVYLVKTDINGNVIWNTTFGEFSTRDKGFSVQQTADGGYIICGQMQISDGGGGSQIDIYLIKTNSQGI